MPVSRLRETKVLPKAAPGRKMPGQFESAIRSASITRLTAILFRPLLSQRNSSRRPSPPKLSEPPPQVFKAAGDDLAVVAHRRRRPAFTRRRRHRTTIATYRSAPSLPSHSFFVQSPGAPWAACLPNRMRARHCPNQQRQIGLAGGRASNVRGLMPIWISLRAPALKGEGIKIATVRRIGGMPRFRCG